MPYIKKEERVGLDNSMEPLVEMMQQMCLNPGDINYVITKIMHTFIKSHGPSCYTSINEAIGILDCAKMELYRVVAGPYEDKKRLHNGCISELDDDSHERMM